MAEYNFEELYFDIRKFGDKITIQESYPELSSYKEISKIKSIDWKIAILFTDIGSPFVKIKDIYQKAEAVFNHLGLDYKKKHKDIFDSIVNYRQCNVNDACSFLIEYHNNHEFAAWYEKNKLYYELTRVISKPLNPDSQNYDKELDRKINLQGKQKLMLNDLKDLEINLFGSSAMKADVVYKSKNRIYNWNERYADNNQVE